ncbi:MAG: TonB-dependent receptor domain-containing protein [Salinibacter sp.]
MLLFGSAMPAAAQKLGVVTGTVVDAAQGEALVGAEVRLRKLDEPTGVRETRTGTEGSFEFPRVRPGRYLLEVSFLGYKERYIPFTFEFEEARHFALELRQDPFSLETVVEAPSRRRQRLLEAPASVSVLEPQRIRRESVTSSVEALRSVVGIDVAQTGVDRREVALRGFNSAFSTAPYVLTDHREAVAPALGLNLYSVMPNTALDLSRIEAVRGPAGALYGTGVDGGVLRFVTRDPFQDPGTSLALSGGSRNYLSAQFRQAGILGDKVGYKFTGQWGRADEWALDPQNSQDAAELRQYQVYDERSAVPTGRNFSRIDRDNDGGPEFRLRREDLYRSYNVNGLLKYRFGRETSLSLRGGYASLTSPLQSPIGTLQASSFAYSYGQLRLETGDLSAQVVLNHNPSGNFTYRYRTGRTISDDGTQVDGRLRYAFEGGPLRTKFLVGGEVDATWLRDEPGVLGPEEDEFTTAGTYLQATTPLASSWTLTLAGRADYLSVREEVQFSPRAALVYTPAPSHALRASYNRAVSVPSASPLLQIASGAPTPPQATITQTWEAGYKGQFANTGRLTLDAYYETRDNVLVPNVERNSFQYRNGGDIEYWGVDASAVVHVTEELTMFGNTSVVSDDSFEGSGRRPIALNAPAFKVKGGFDYRLPRFDASIGATAHYVDDFPVRYGPYTGTVSSYSLLDVRARAAIPSVPGLSVNLTAKNVLGNEHREFVGAPALGRMVIARLTYEIPL